MHSSLTVPFPLQRVRQHTPKDLNDHHIDDDGDDEGNVDDDDEDGDYDDDDDDDDNGDGIIVTNIFSTPTFPHYTL